MENRSNQGREVVSLNKEEQEGLQQRNENGVLTSLEAYMAGFGFNPRKESLPEWYFTQFYLAQRVERYIKDLHISISTTPDEKGPKQVIEKEVEKTREKTIYTEDEEEVDFPTNSMGIGTIDALTELPDILQTEWLQEETNPELFYQKAANQSLLKPEWRRATRVPHTSTETVKEKELVEVQAPPTTKKQHAYVLRDISSSTDALDNRSSIIRALALAFLKQGYVQGSQLAIRDFNDSPQSLSQGKSQQDLKRISQELLGGYLTGGTDIQLALETAVSDISKGGKFQRADILLLTDGLSELGRNPLGKIKLHTIIVGSENPSSELKRWSTTYRHLEPYQIPDLAPNKSEVKDVAKATDDLRKRAVSLSSLQELSQLKKDTEAVKQVIQTYQSYDKKNAEELARSKKVVEELEQRLSSQKQIDDLLKKKQDEERKQREREEQLKIEEELKRRQAEEELREKLTKLTQKYSYPEDQNTPTPSKQQQNNSESIFSYLSRKVKRAVATSKEYVESVVHKQDGGGKRE